MIETFNSLLATSDHGLLAFITLFGLAVVWLVASCLIMIVIWSACLLAKCQCRESSAKPSPEIGRQIKGRITALNPRLLK